VYEPQVLQFVAAGEHLDFPDLVLRLLRAGKKVATYRSEADWLDLGRPEDFQRATDLFAERPQAFLPPAV
jgi:NDP-sugar pyrophosphorylase family protein